jgi:hypothetical protein
VFLLRAASLASEMRLSRPRASLVTNALLFLRRHLVLRMNVPVAPRTNLRVRVHLPSLSSPLAAAEPVSEVLSASDKDASEVLLETGRGAFKDAETGMDAAYFTQDWQTASSMKCLLFPHPSV